MERVRKEVHIVGEKMVASRNERRIEEEQQQVDAQYLVTLIAISCSIKMEGL